MNRAFFTQSWVAVTLDWAEGDEFKVAGFYLHAFKVTKLIANINMLTPLMVLNNLKKV
ncbi:MAG: hypothetical protein IKA83_06835 [Paludibacteraceae bacterium]|nr:hypothetical protein [Paludibacteraceae bacterium]